MVIRIKQWKEFLAVSLILKKLIFSTSFVLQWAGHHSQKLLPFFSGVPDRSGTSVWFSVGVVGCWEDGIMDDEEQKVGEVAVTSTTEN